jgi:hypothetical protein
MGSNPLKMRNESKRTAWTWCSWARKGIGVHAPREWGLGYHTQTHPQVLYCILGSSYKAKAQIMLFFLIYYEEFFVSIFKGFFWVYFI